MASDADNAVRAARLADLAGVEARIDHEQREIDRRRERLAELESTRQDILRDLAQDAARTRSDGGQEDGS